MGYLENQKTCEFALPPLGAWCRKSCLHVLLWVLVQKELRAQPLVVLLNVNMTKGIGKKMKSKCSLPVM
jgi:hypothetical protein